MAHNPKLGIRGGVCGIYAISTPNGSTYIGSSCDIRRRWYDHRSAMKHQRSKSPALDRAFIKHGENLVWKVIEECSRAELLDREQFYIDTMLPRLNASKNARFAINSLRKQSPSFDRMLRSAYAKRDSSRSRPVQAEDGRIFVSVQEASRVLGIRAGGITTICQTQNRRGDGLRMRYLDEEWREEISLADRVRAAQIKSAASGRGRIVSAETRLKKSLATKGVPWSDARRARFIAKGQTKHAR